MIKKTYENATSDGFGWSSVLPGPANWWTCLYLFYRFIVYFCKMFQNVKKTSIDNPSLFCHLTVGILQADWKSKSFGHLWTTYLTLCALFKSLLAPSVVSSTMSAMAVATLTCCANSHPFQERRIAVTDSIKVGRSVAQLRPGTTNAIFDCKVLSRNHALLWYDNGRVSLN